MNLTFRQKYPLVSGVVWGAWILFAGGVGFFTTVATSDGLNFADIRGALFNGLLMAVGCYLLYVYGQELLGKSLGELVSSVQSKRVRRFVGKFYYVTSGELEFEVNHLQWNILEEGCPYKIVYSRRTKHLLAVEGV